MWEIKTENIRIDSACPGLQGAGAFLWCENQPPRAILQLCHGMCEYGERYRPFGEFMARQGFAVCWQDHLGHGETSSLPGGVDGYFGPGPGAEYLLADMKTLNEKARAFWPGLPVVLLGHSMGSFLARCFAAQWPELLDCLILSGTGGKNPLVGLGIGLAKLFCRVKGDLCRPDFLQKMAFGAYLKNIPAPKTPYDWISRDEELVARYAADPKCTFVFTASAFRELFRLYRRANGPRCFEDISREMPIFIFSGLEDPVGGWGKGVQWVYRRLRATGHSRVKLKLYLGGRHEMLNETNKEQVYGEVLAWCQTALPPATQQ